MSNQTHGKLPEGDRKRAEIYLGMRPPKPRVASVPEGERRRVRISRRAILALYGISLAILCLWVPWKFEFSRRDPRAGIIYFAGYSTPWSPPAPEQIRSNVPMFATWGDGSIKGFMIGPWAPSLSLDWQRIGLEWVFLTALAGVAFPLAPISIPLPVRRSPSPVVQAQEIGQAELDAPQESQAPASQVPAQRVRPYRFGTFWGALMIIGSLFLLFGSIIQGIRGMPFHTVLLNVLLGLAFGPLGWGLMGKRRWAYRLYLGYVIVIGIGVGGPLLLALVFGRSNDYESGRQIAMLLWAFLVFGLPAIYFFKRRREFV